VACSSPSSTEDGFATPAAALASLALSILVIASVGAGVSALSQARAKLERTEAEWALAGAQQRAQLTVMAATGEAVVRSSLPTDTGTVSLLAEPEAPKLGLAAAADLDDEALRRLGASDVEAVRRGLTQLRLHGGGWLAIRELDPSSAWRRCALSFVSPFGTALATTAEASPLEAQALTTPSRVGQVWRVRVSDAAGWSDDRLVRFTGDRRHPTATIERALTHEASQGGSCDVPTSAN
jgi:hypothetical protein